jgi:cytochrome oxidase Cu insertion factor (SCO1/SenC/PrrC family)
MMIRKLLVFTAVVIAFSGCSGRKQFRIEGTVDKSRNSYIYLRKVEVDTPVLTDSSKIRNNGNFSFRVTAEEPDFYQVGYSDSNFVTILAEPGERIRLSFPGIYLYDDYKVSGSPGTASLIMLDSALARTKSRIDSLSALYAGIVNEPGSATWQEEINNEYVRLLKEQRMYNIGFILKNLRSFASIKALYQRIDNNMYVLYDSRDLQFLKIVSDTLSHLYPGSKQVRALKRNFENELNQTNLRKINELTKNLPSTKLDADLKDMNGKRISLSSLKGKYVLLAFWSVASQDCLEENLRLKEYYKKYRNRGFEIYQVNLDTDEEAWKRGVKYDELPWISVREDDPLNPKTAILYNVRVLPANYLYDREGNIIGNNLHGRTLELRLSQLFGE